MSERKFKLKLSAIFGTIVGVVVFSIFYYLDPALKYLLIIPFGTLMGWGYTYSVKDSDLDFDDGSDKD